MTELRVLAQHHGAHLMWYPQQKLSNRRSQGNRRGRVRKPIPRGAQGRSVECRLLHRGGPSLGCPDWSVFKYLEPLLRYRS